MSDPSLLVQGAVIAALKAAAPLTAIVGVRVYDRVPQGTVPPYVKLAGWQVIEDGADCLDGVEIHFDVQCFSAAIGRPEVARMAAAVVAALDKLVPALAGYDCGDGIAHRQTLFLLETDGITERAVVTFRALVDKA